MTPLDALLQLLHPFANYIFGFFGTSVRVAIGHERGEKLSLTRVYIIVVSGTILAGTAGDAMAQHAGMPLIFGKAISFLIGIFATGFIYQVYDGKIKIPFLTQLGQPGQTEEK